MGNLSTPKSVQKLRKALHAKAKAEAGYRFYALYDKISREDILAHAYAQCRSNKGAPGVDGQEFADIEAYGLQRWLGELALALRQQTYRPDPIRRVFIPKANGKFRPLGISTLRDRVCMTAAMLVLEPIFEADLPPEQYAYRPGRNAQQAVVEVGALLDHGHPEVVDADLADYFGSIPHAELLKSVTRRIVDRRVLHLIKPDAGNLHVRFDERDVETEVMVEPLRHRQTKEAATAMFDLQPPRHISTLHEAAVCRGATSGRVLEMLRTICPRPQHRRP